MQLALEGIAVDVEATRRAQQVALLSLQRSSQRRFFGVLSLGRQA